MLDWNDHPLWLALGLFGNVLFASRFVLQWIASERAGETTVPVAFWYLSIAGSLALLVYALHLGSPVFALAFLPNSFVYWRNLALTRRSQRS